MPFRTTPWRAYLRRIRASSDAAKRRWIVVVGSGTGALVIALWVVYLSAALPARLDGRSGGPTRMNTSPGEATTTTSESPQGRAGPPDRTPAQQSHSGGVVRAGDTFTNGIRGIRDLFSERWRGARNTLNTSWQSLTALITEGSEFSVMGTTTPASPEPTGSSEPPQTP